MGLRAGIFPELNDNVEFGAELSLANSGLGEQPDAVQLGAGMDNKSISLSQAYLALLSHSKRNHFIFSLGKFYIPFNTSPVTWDTDIRPEGFYESYIYLSPSEKFRLQFQTAQFSADQVDPSLVNSTPLRRFWLFVQGMDLQYKELSMIHFRWSEVFYFFYQNSERLQKASVGLGNSPESETQLSQLKENFAPLESLFEIESQQFGLLTKIRSSFAINLRSSDHQRAFFVQISTGRSWVRHFFLAKVGFCYNEPDVQLALFEDNEWGNANRKSTRFELDYFLTDHLKLGSSFVLAQVIRSSPYQNDRKEFYGELEYHF